MDPYEYEETWGILHGQSPAALRRVLRISIDSDYPLSETCTRLSDGRGWRFWIQVDGRIANIDLV